MMTSSDSIIYECNRCSGRMLSTNLEERGGEIKCIHCGFRVLHKVKPPIVKRVKAV